MSHSEGLRVIPAESSNSNGHKVICEMKSIQPFSTKDEYIYAMKEDLAEWFNSMYDTKLNVLNFIELLENGVTICLHANNVMRAAINTHEFYQSDLSQAGIINIPQSSIKQNKQTPPSNSLLNRNNKVLLTPGGKSSVWAGDYLLYRADAKPQSYQARDNVSNFIKWCRFIAKVRECLMFETDDLISRKNEKNFILCLLEVARYGSKFGIQVPTLIKLEQEIEAEIQQEKAISNLKINFENQLSVNIDKQTEIEPLIVKVISPKYEPDIPKQQEIEIYVNEDVKPSKDQLEMVISQISDKIVKSPAMRRQLSNRNSLVISLTQKDFDRINLNRSLDSSSFEDSFEQAFNSDQYDKKSFDDSLEDVNNYIDEEENRKTRDLNQEWENKAKSQINSNANSNTSFSNTSPLIPSPLSTSVSSTNSSSFALTSPSETETNKNFTLEEKPKADSDTNINEFKFKQSDETLLINTNNQDNNKNNSFLFENEKKSPEGAKNSNTVVKNLNKIFMQREYTENTLNDKFKINRNINNVRSRSASPDANSKSNNPCNKMSNSFEPSANLSSLNLNTSENNLHKHVCTIADRCTCEKQFPVVKIGEGKYRIGNTKNIVFIRILRNHIMVRVGGGWDTLENYLNKHDPCRCPGEAWASIQNQGPNKSNETSQLDTCSSNILLTPVNSSTSSTTHRQLGSALSHNPFIKSQPKSNVTKTCHSHPLYNKSHGVDFTDAKLVVERNQQGQHIVGKILLISQPEETPPPPPILNKSTSNNSLNSTLNNHSKLIYASPVPSQTSTTTTTNNEFEMNPLKQNHFAHHNINNLNYEQSQNLTNTNTLSSKIQKPFFGTSKISSPQQSNKNESLLKNKMKKLIRIPTHSPSNTQRKNLPIQSPPKAGLLKFNRTNETASITTTTTGYSSLCDDSSSDFLEHTPIYTETKLPPRILKKYEKKRANTEALFEPEQIIIASSTTGESSSGLNSPNLINKIEDYDLETSSAKKATSSPKPPPRHKKKYRKSKTTDMSKYLEESNIEDADSLDGDFYFEENNTKNSKKEEIKTQILSPIQNEMDSFKLSDSLESLKQDSNDTNRIEDDSLLANHGISLSVSTTSSLSNVNENEMDLLNSSKTKRAQWDKSRPVVDYKSQISVQPIKPKPKQIPHSSTLNTIPKLIVTNSPRRDSSVSSNPNSKKARNLNLAKEQLYEMKKTIDAKMSNSKLEAPKTNPVRTTPRKIKKRSGERSLTTGIITEAEIEEINKAKQDTTLSRPTTPRSVSKTPVPKQITNLRPPTSSSLHNLSNCLNETINSQRSRRDSSVSSVNNSTLNNTYISSTANEFKENKAYELRKKSTLLNKIIIKNQQNDPIYSRSHPICAEITEQQALNITENMPNLMNNLTNIGSYENTARKRLFAKKNEKPFDPNLSFGSNVSSNFSSNSIPTSNSMNFNTTKPKIVQSSPLVTKTKLNPKKPASPAKTQTPSRSKSNNDLYYELERTNSTQDLLELINNCEPPQGDMHKYKLLLSECENYDPRLKKAKQNINKKLKIPSKPETSPRGGKGVERDSLEFTDEEVALSSQPRQSSHRRSRSLPAFAPPIAHCEPIASDHIGKF